jgi:toxin ParE2
VGDEIALPSPGHCRGRGCRAVYYEARRPGFGGFFQESLLRCVDQIAETPRRYARVEAPVSAREIRNLSLDGFPYSVIYEVFEDEVVILAVAHQHRRSAYWKSREG